MLYNAGSAQGYEDRAAILEHDAGLPRAEAERLAAETHPLGARRAASR